MTSGNVDGNAQKQDTSVFAGNQKICSDQTKIDGVRKELYENERKARENWAWKWGFFRNSKKLWKKEAAKRGLKADADESFPKNSQKNLQSYSEGKMPSKGTLLSSGSVPKKSSVSPDILLVLVVALVITIGVITCVVSGRSMGGRPGGPAEPATAPMLALQPGMDRLGHELSAQRDRLVRLQSVQTDLALDLPPSIPLPDGEEIPYGSATRLQIRDPEQESEIYQKCIRPPPNRTVFGGHSPPHRSSSAGILSSDWSSGSNSGSLVVRCHSVSGAPSKRPANILGRTVRCLSGKRCHHPSSSSSSEDSSSVSSIPSSRGSGKPTAVSVVVPSHRCRRLSAFSDTASSSLASLPTVQCVSPATSVSSGSPQVSRSSAEELSRCHSVGNSCDSRTNDSKSKNKCDRSTV